MAVLDCYDSRGRRNRGAVTLFVTVGILCAVSGWPRPADSARVLAFETVAAKSHWHFMKSVLRALVDRGHQVTVYTPFADGASPATDNYTEVDTYSVFSEFMVSVDMDTAMVLPMFGKLSYLLPFLVDGSRLGCDIMDELLADRGGDGDEFDLFLTEPLSSDCVSHVARRLGLPLIYIVPSPLLPWIETTAFGHYANPAYVPNMLSAYSALDTFYRRMHNVGLNLYTVYLNYRHTAAAAAAQNRHYDRAPPVKPSLVFVNTHYITEPTRPMPANRVDVGGVHLKTPEPLPAVSIATTARDRM